MDVTAPQGVLYSFVTLNSVKYLTSRSLSFFISGQYLKNVLMDSIQIWHVIVTSFEGVPYLR